MGQRFEDPSYSLWSVEPGKGRNGNRYLHRAFNTMAGSTQNACVIFISGGAKKIDSMVSSWAPRCGPRAAFEDRSSKPEAPRTRSNFGSLKSLKRQHSNSMCLPARIWADSRAAMSDAVEVNPANFLSNKTWLMSGRDFIPAWKCPSWSLHFCWARGEHSTFFGLHVCWARDGAFHILQPRSSWHLPPYLSRLLQWPCFPSYYDNVRTSQSSGARRQQLVARIEFYHLADWDPITRRRATFHQRYRKTTWPKKWWFQEP